MFMEFQRSLTFHSAQAVEALKTNEIIILCNRRGEHWLMVCFALIGTTLRVQMEKEHYIQIRIQTYCQQFFLQNVQLEKVV